LLIGALLLFVGTGVGLAIYCFSGDTKPEAGERKAPPVVQGNPPQVPVVPPQGIQDPNKDKKEEPKKRKPPKEEQKDPPVVQPKPRPSGPPALGRKEQQKVDQAIDKGVAYLKSVQNEDGTWSHGTGKKSRLEFFKVGYSALAGLTLLECGVKPNDQAIQRTADFIRASEDRIEMTYDLALAILFLDRLDHGKGKRPDKELIQKLALRLVAGQKASGGWTYACTKLTADEQEQLLSLLKKHKLTSPLKMQGVDQAKLVLPNNEEVSDKLKNLAVWRKDTDASNPNRDASESDNSNTQFAILALWVAKQYDLPLDRTLALIVKRFRKGQNEDGSWGYLADGQEMVKGVKHPTMTCAGLLGLAVGMGLSNEAKLKSDKGQPRLAATKDKQVKAGLDFLAEYIGRFNKPWKKVSLIDLYYIWSIERVAVIYNLPKIGDKNWYAWGAEMLVANQSDKGKWANGQYPDSTPVIDTCFALLFLKKANLARDLTSKLQSSDD
jgi:hypothetical protein